VQRRWGTVNLLCIFRRLFAYVPYIGHTSSTKEASFSYTGECPDRSWKSEWKGIFVVCVLVTDFGCRCGGKFFPGSICAFRAAASNYYQSSRACSPKSDSANDSKVVAILPKFWVVYLSAGNTRRGKAEGADRYGSTNPGRRPHTGCTLAAQSLHAGCTLAAGTLRWMYGGCTVDVRWMEMRCPPSCTW
jgi:hypothetical protein